MCKELLLCPFCGEEIEIVCIGGGWFWRHKNDPSDSECLATHTKKYSSYEEALAAWNARKIHKEGSAGTYVDRDELISVLGKNSIIDKITCSDGKTIREKIMEMPTIDIAIERKGRKS